VRRVKRKHPFSIVDEFYYSFSGAAEEIPV